MPCKLCRDLGMVPSPGDWKENGGWEECPLCYPLQHKEPNMFWKLWRRFLAVFRLDMEAVCEQSKGNRDYHDYPDSASGQPDHMIELECKRCGKRFYI